MKKQANIPQPHRKDWQPLSLRCATDAYLMLHQISEMECVSKTAVVEEAIRRLYSTLGILGTKGLKK